MRAVVRHYSQAEAPEDGYPPMYLVAEAGFERVESVLSGDPGAVTIRTLQGDFDITRVIEVRCYP